MNLHPVSPHKPEGNCFRETRKHIHDTRMIGTMEIAFMVHVLEYWEPLQRKVFTQSGTG